MIPRQSDNLWTAEQPLRFLGLEMGARMTVINLGGTGDLFVHSPIHPTPELIEAVRSLGQVKYIMAPNLFHHLFVADFRSHFPEARLYCAPGLEKKRADIAFDEIVSTTDTYPWSEHLDHIVVEGAPLCNEVVFFVRKEKVLLVTDLGLNIGDNSAPMTRWAFKAMGMFKKYGWSIPEKWLFVRDKEKFLASSKKILKWDFEKIFLAHGDLVQENGHQQFELAFGS